MLTINKRVYIYTIPPESAQRDCSGTVTAVEYCYRAIRSDVNMQQTKDVFYILSLTPSINRTQFTVNRRISINSTASGNICVVSQDRRSQFVCCENKSLEYQIPSSNFTFGIVARKDFRLLISANRTTEYIHQTTFAITANTQEGNRFESDRLTNMSLLLLRFYTR